MANHGNPVPEWLNAEYIQKFLRLSLDDPDLFIHTVDIEPGSAVGDNYVCQIFRIKINLSSNKIKGNYLSIIGKAKVEALHLQEMDNDMFGIEARYFTLLQPKLIDVLKKKNVPEFFPKCHYYDDDHKIIFMEDLKFSGNMELQPHGKYLTLKQVELVIEALASLHAASIHLVQENPGLTEIFNKHLWSENPPPVIVKLFENASNFFKNHINLYDISDEWKNRLIGIIRRVEDGWIKIYECEEGHLNVLSHGDNWLKNVMFRFTEKGADKVVLLDYQGVNYSSFANDLHYLLFSSAESDVIINNTDQLLRRYYAKFIEIAPDTPELSFERIKSEYTAKYYYGYLMMIIIRPFVVAEKIPDLELMLQGKPEDIGYNHPVYISDVEKLLPFFEKLGVY